MSSFTHTPAAPDGRWNLDGRAVQVHITKNGRVNERRFFIEWPNADGNHHITLVCNQGFTTEKEAEAFVDSIYADGRITVRAVADIDEADAVVWMKHHASPHPEAANPFDYPWGNPMTFDRPL